MASPWVPRCVRRRRRARSLTIAAAALASSALGAVEIADPAPRMMWNASPSAPLGLYRVAPATMLSRGDLVLVRPPPAAAAMAAERGYLPPGVPLVKHIEAVGGDVVCLRDGRISINGAELVQALPTDGSGRPLSSWRGCRALAPHEVFVLMRGVPQSFDSRYFGPVSRADILGKAAPLWTW